MYTLVLPGERFILGYLKSLVMLSRTAYMHILFLLFQEKLSACKKERFNMLLVLCVANPFIIFQLIIMPSYYFPRFKFAC